MSSDELEKGDLIVAAMELPTEDFEDEIEELEMEIERLRNLIRDWATKSTHPVCRCEQCTAMTNELIAMSDRRRW